jgi:uroporphyrinogen decarboxylase
MSDNMTALDRVFAALGHKEPDRVPYFFLSTTLGARELGMPVTQYLASAATFVKGQYKLRERYGHDCLYNHLYTAQDVEAWGGRVHYFPDGPPNAGLPPIEKVEDIYRLKQPDIMSCPALVRVLDATRMMSEAQGHEVPIIGGFVSPFTLPIMQLGFDRYLEVLNEDPEAFEALMEANIEFCVEWGNAQKEAGATALAYVDPLSSPSLVPRELYLRTGYPVAQRVVPRMKAPVVISFGSARLLPIIDKVLELGFIAVGAGPMEDLAELKALVRGKMAIVGNMNNVEMCSWSRGMSRRKVIEAIRGAAHGGGFILSDSIGDIPYQTPDEVLGWISETARSEGVYPIPGR